MADEVLFEFLHMEIVAHVSKSHSHNEQEPGKCITILEKMGFRVGQGLIERITKDSPSFKDDLDVMKFICKEFWNNTFRKQIDNLRTNHQISLLATVTTSVPFEVITGASVDTGRYSHASCSARYWITPQPSNCTSTSVVHSLSLLSMPMLSRHLSSSRRPG
ncbi:trafficking protein particle complex subunit 6b-like [Protopterus annectens]|uniref:trafficking protein particle complex subunit 6b-like n=1 Tax=Protopterus annectens TaxID=7888 RepID=UPI001CFC0B59|nr:trafficking protein particle complex subunit 6b-like [Protopterus annectens]